MCLSTVYQMQNGEQTKMAEYVSGVRAEGSRITLTDIMGLETVLFGTVKSVDLVKNQIIIESMQDAK